MYFWLEVTFFSTLNEVVNKNSLVLFFFKLNVRGYLCNIRLSKRWGIGVPVPGNDFTVDDFKKNNNFHVGFFFLKIQKKKKAFSSLKTNIIFKLSVFF